MRLMVADRGASRKVPAPCDASVRTLASITAEVVGRRTGAAFEVLPDDDSARAGIQLPPDGSAEPDEVVPCDGLPRSLPHAPPAVADEGVTFDRLHRSALQLHHTESFASELRAFVGAVLEGKQTPVTGIVGRIPVVMALAARKSYDEGRPVRLAEIG